MEKFFFKESAKGSLPFSLWIYFGLGSALVTVAGEVIGLSQPDVAIVCCIKQVYVADENLERTIKPLMK